MYEDKQANLGSYINLLRASKISFYSTPGIDGGEKRTGGFNPVTPRYLELLSAQCQLLGKTNCLKSAPLTLLKQQ